MKVTLLLILSTIAPLGVAAAQSAAASVPEDSLHPISLQEAVSLAQRNAPAAVQARGQLRTTSSAVRSAYGTDVASVNFEYPPRLELGDLALTTPFDLANVVRRPPREIAQKLATELMTLSLIAELGYFE